MGNENVDVKSALKIFRNSWIHENDVQPLLDMEKEARDRIEEILQTVSDGHLKNKLVEYIQYLPMMRASGLNPVMENNTVSAIKEAFSVLFNNKKSEKDRLKAFWNLESVGKKYASYFMDIATRGEYLFYDVTLLKALKQIEPKMLPDDFYDVESIDDMLKFMEACRKVYKKYGFTSFAELRGFLWNGYGSRWTFDI